MLGVFFPFLYNPPTPTPNQKKKKERKKKKNPGLFLSSLIYANLMRIPEELVNISSITPRWGISSSLGEEIP